MNVNAGMSGVTSHREVTATARAFSLPFNSGMAATYSRSGRKIFHTVWYFGSVFLYGKATQVVPHGAVRKNGSSVVVGDHSDHTPGASGVGGKI